jgi:hypothetical protein
MLGELLAGKTEEDWDDVDVQRLVGTDTRVYASTLNEGRLWWGFLSVTFFVSFVLLVASRGKPILLGSGLSIFFISAILLFLWRQYYQVAKYENAVKLGKWPYGVLCFNRGDVAIKLPGIFKHTELNIEVSYLVRAEPLALFPLRRVLRVHYLSIDAKAQTIDISQRRLRESVADIAAFINDMKTRQGLPAGSYTLSL